MKSCIQKVFVLSLFTVVSLAVPILGEERLEVSSDQSGAAIGLTGAAPFHTTTGRITDERLIQVPGTGTRLALWNETDGGGAVSPYYAISRAGEPMGQSVRTSYTLRLRHGDFDPSRSVAEVDDFFSSGEGENLHIVQFETQPLAEYRRALRFLGGETLGYLPGHAVIVRVSPGNLARVHQLPFVRWSGPYHPAYRLEEFLRDNRENATEAYPSQRYNILTFEEGESGLQKVLQRLKALGDGVEPYPGGKYLATALLTPVQLYRVARWDEVQFIDRWTPMEKDMDIVREIGGANYLETVAGYTGAGVRAEIFDAGFNIAHPDFQSRPLIEHGGVVGNDSHGTATAGVNFGDGTGDPRARGIMPDGQGIVADYSNVGLNGATRYAHTGELLQDPYYAVFQTSSVGDGRTFNYTTISADHDTLLFDWDLLHCQSQSNAGNQDSRPQAWAKNVLSGGAFNHYDTLTRTDDCWCNSGSIGPASDGRIKPDLSFFYDDTYTTYSTGAGYGEFGGTSGATPSICGYSGLFFEMWSDGIFGNEVDPLGTVFENRPHMTTAKAFMINTADQHPFTGQSHDLTRVHQGWGVPDIRNLYDMRDNISFIDESFLLTNMEGVEFNALVDPGEPALRVTMTYADPAGNPAASQHRVNDISVKVTSPSAVVYHGNVGLLDGNWSTPGGVPNNYDTVENVFVDNPEEGLWIIELTAAEINQDGHVETPELDADFALVVSGAFMTKCTSDGRISFNGSKYACEDQARVRVVDCDLNTDDGTIQTVAVSLTSGSEPAGETLILTETDPASGTFQELIAVSETDASGVLQVANGDLITAEYIDADNGEGGTNLSKTRQAEIDCSEPLITGVGESGVSDVAATVTWTTDENASSELVWGGVIPPTNSVARAGNRTDHAINLSGLSACTIYHYEVRSEDPYGNMAVDDNGGEYYHFETMGDFGSGLQPCHAGQVDFDQAVVSCADTLSFQVVDLDLNTDPAVVETVTLFVSSSSEPAAEPVVATETGANTAVFTGSIGTAPGAAASDGQLQTAGGDLLTVTYHDHDDGFGATAVSFATAVADCSGPAIQNLRVTDLTDQRFTVRWETGEPADTWLEWGATPSLGTTVSSPGLTTSHAVTLNQFDACGHGYLSVRGTDIHGNLAVADLGGQPYVTSTGMIPGLYWQDTFENGSGGWTLDGEWEIGQPQGLGGSSGGGDPSDAFNNAGILGHDLSGQGAYGGDYEPDTSESASSPTLDATSWTNTRLILTRRLNVHTTDTASMWLWTDSGRPLFLSDGTMNESSYQVQVLDIPQQVDGKPAIRLEFKQQADGATQYSGWNVDDLIFKDGSLPDNGVCADCSGNPSFAGIVSAMDNNACGLDGVTVSWNPAFSWGSGSGGTYAVYRDMAPGFAPSPANQVASGIAGLSWVDNTAPTGQQVYYLVRAESDETCGGGPNNGGMTDSGTVYAAVTDTDTQAVPGEVTGFAVDLSNSVHVRLSWSAPPNASGYRVYRSTDPQPGTFLQLGETSETFLDDTGAGANANRYYYKVAGVNACGQEGL
ncbi:MAG: hypothetical protein IFK94_10440 [Acidobacteria bacterium]|uniref:Peptidase S8/S53 domain-containing protein n=1 Tax=Candidatus Polarisedimenticola svalbardensis TaxID=2886004 RepID=A0A8J6Y5H3_9BACT|nr:hypothetical protein [Candidatus Polarisedimenticola svalbardensis]